MTPKRPNGAGAFPIPVEHPVPKPPDTTSLYAALDLGTNSCRMLIAQPKGSQFHVVDSFSKSVQLGQGLEQTGKLSRASMARTMNAMRVCRQKLQRHNVNRMRLVATEACRRATNTQSFVQQVKRETGLTLEVIQPEEEARLAVISCAPLVSTKTEQLLVVDIGGGSTELVWIDLSNVPKRERPRAIMRLHSGFRQDPGPFAAAKVVDWISVPWVLRPCAINLPMWKTILRALPSCRGSLRKALKSLRRQRQNRRAKGFRSLARPAP